MIERKSRHENHVMNPLQHPKFTVAKVELTSSLRLYIQVFEPGQEIWVPFDLWPVKPQMLRLRSGPGETDIPVLKKIHIRDNNCVSDAHYNRKGK